MHILSIVGSGIVIGWVLLQMETRVIIYEDVQFDYCLKFKDYSELTI